MDLLDSILDATEIYEKYGLKGCIISILAVVLIVGGIIAAVYIFA